MGSYTAISDAGKTIVDFLRKKCVPPIEKPELIGLCSPDDTGNFILGICLYDIEERTDLKTGRDIVIDETHVKNPPSLLDLYYMIFTALKSDIAVRAADEQRILGSVFQKLADNRIISEGLAGTLSESSESINITFENKPYEDKIRIWTAYNLPPKQCLFYKVSGIAVESETIRSVKRVTDADISVRQRELRSLRGIVK
ncbi:MAG: Pvc16 family protein [Ruminiclostridium sp.]